MKNKNVERYMDLARDMARSSSFKRAPMGCVITHKKTIIGSGVNSYKTHPLQKEYNKLRFEGDNTPHYLHAEMAALIPLQHLEVDWSKVSLYIYRVKKGNPSKIGYARPCEGCMKYIKSLGIKNLYYTGEQVYIHEVLDI